MALTKYQLADKLRTMKQGGSKAPMQNVKLPTNQSSYRTPSMTSTSPGTAEKQAQMGANPQALAAAGGLLGKIGKGAWDAFNRPETMALDKASSANLGNVGNMMELMKGSNVDMAANMAGNTAGNLANLPQPSMIGNGIPTVGDWSNAANTVGKIDGAAELGNLSNVNDAVANATEAAGEAANVGANASNFSFPGVGTAIGVGADIAGGNYAKGLGRAGGAAVGTMVGGPLGGALGGFLGAEAGDLFNRWF